MSWFEQNADDSYRQWMQTQGGTWSTPGERVPTDLASLGGARTVVPETPGTPSSGVVGTNGAPVPPVAGGMYAQMDTGGGQFPLSSVAGSGLMAPWTTAFNAPTGESVMNEPGYAFGMKEGINAIDRSAAARGTLFSGGTGKALARYATDYATTKYNDAYNRAFNEYRTAHDIFKGNQADQFNRLSSVAGTGQTAANQLGASGSSYANQGANLMTDAGNAAAAGRIGSGNAWANTIGGIGQDALSLYALSQRR